MRREVLLLRRSAFSLTPVTREEHYLSRMIGQSGDVFPPVTRREYYLAYMAGDEVPVPVPVTVDEMFLYALCGKSDFIPKPVTRLQMFMANSLGEEYELTPITREEMYWNEYVGGAVYDTASGPIATFIAKESPVKQLSIAVEPVQNGTGDPSPDNVRPISGWTEAKVTRTGKNLVNVNSTENINAYIDNLGRIHANGAWKTCSYIPVEAGKSYCLSGLTSHPNSGTDNYLTYDKNKTLLGVVTLKINSYPVTFNASVAFVRFCWKISEEATVMFEQSPTATAYEPYNGNTYTIQLGETVYGGTLDVVNGKMTVETVKYTFNGTENWNVPSSIAWRGTLYSTGGTIKPNANNASKVGVVCDYFKEVTPNEAYSKSVGIAVDPNGYVFIVPTGESLTVDSFKAWLATNNVTAVFPLATPFELTLTPEQIATLQGTNNVWSDAGDVTVEYRVR